MIPDFVGRIDHLTFSVALDIHEIWAVVEAQHGERTHEPEVRNQLRWHWSWGVPIGRLDGSSRLLAVDDIEELIRSISKVVCVPLRRGM